MEQMNLGVLFILGIGIFGGMLGARFFQRIHIPQVVGYIAIGLIIGGSGFGLVDQQDIIAFRPFNMFALGVIGFLVGGELKLDTFKKYAAQFIAILLGEGIGAFVVVTLAVTTLMWFVVHNMSIALAAGIVFGAIASATDPASTVDVLWEYRGRGVLTTTVTAIVALDDALAMTLYGLGTSAAAILAGTSSSLVVELGHISVEVFGSLIAGGIFALILRFLLRWMHEPERATALAIGLILLLISLCTYWHMDVILAAMSLGFALTNLAPRRSDKLFKFMRGFSVPIYVLFFVLVGARITISQMPIWLWGIVALYVLGRATGKIIGAYTGARFTHADPVVRRYLGLALMPQGGVAVGLSIMASQYLSEFKAVGDMALGDVVIFGVTATTLIAQVLGPPMVKLAVKLADETGRNVTEQDVVESLTAADVMDREIVSIRDNEPVAKAVQTIMANDFVVYPVVDEKNLLVGLLSVEDMKSILGDQDTWVWLVTADIMQPVVETTYPGSILKQALNKMRDANLTQMPVVDEQNGHAPVGMLDYARARKRVSKEMLRRQHSIHEPDEQTSAA
ncbi:MAG: cation:proton antiporter [Candidatus Hydrogenedentes bacterium]|nr:cation:proton antiporter [Candidatus Hydrogenedentota bacterium]